MAVDIPDRLADGPETPIPEPEVAASAVEKYDALTPPGAVAPERALVAAIPDDGIIAHPKFQTRDPVDRIWCYTGRVDGEWFTVAFLEVDGRVVDVWLAAECDYPAIRAYLFMRGMEGLAR